MNMNGVHCQVSPTSTIRRADQAFGRPATTRRGRSAGERGERPLLHVGEHAERVGDADRGHHQRDEEDDAEEVAAADRLGAEQREAEAERELHGDADDDVEQRGHAACPERRRRRRWRATSSDERRRRGVAEIRRPRKPRTVNAASRRSGRARTGGRASDEREERPSRTAPSG